MASENREPIAKEKVGEKKKIETVNVIKGILPVIALLAGTAEHLFVPNKQVINTTGVYSKVLIAVLVIAIVLFVISFFIKKVGKVYFYRAPFLAAVILFFTVWDLATLKLSLLPLPFFPGPDKVLNVFVSDGALLLKCAVYSVRLLFCGYMLGASIGLATGTLIGWNQKADYWIGPLLRIIGPIPATAWIPIALVAFPTSFLASVFLIALAVWFPVTVMTSTGIHNVQNSFFEVAKTLGGNQKFLIFKVAVPAAMPSIFIGLFMGMGTSFVTLIAAEMLGVKAGLGWYINWSQGWAEYNKVYACLIVLAAMFSGLIKLLFFLKDKLLGWQKGLIKW
ncbi:MAG: ABC transporter permease subunit [Lachnospiraceae bacterium]|nr:ABC transporter permease subunit [Lachnospiraceae bacterium]